jgi:hypothetical protein
VYDKTMSGYVYLIGTPIFGWYKIGKSKTPNIRVRDLGILLPFKIKVLGVWKAQNHSLLEESLHEMFDKYRINGEWFEFSGQEIGKVFNVIPESAIVFPSENSLMENLANFSNVDEDTKGSKKIIGVRTQKLRGNFTPEEREAKRQEAIERQRLKKANRITTK